MKAPTHVKLHNYGETFTIDRPRTNIQNILLGSTYIEHIGTMSCRKVN